MQNWLEFNIDKTIKSRLSRLSISHKSKINTKPSLNNMSKHDLSNEKLKMLCTKVEEILTDKEDNTLNLKLEPREFSPQGGKFKLNLKTHYKPDK